MSALGVPLMLWIGPSVPVPAPPMFVEALENTQVSLNDSGRSGFQISFRVGRDHNTMLDYELLNGPLLQPFSRVILVVLFNGIPDVLMDGIITNQQLAPGQQPGTSSLTVTGEDVSVMMDLEQKSVEHPAQNEMVIALKIIATYAQYGLIPMVIPPPSIDMPIPTERTPVQQQTDLQYLRHMAQRFAYEFYITPGPAPLTNTAYWGPPQRLGIPQKALSVNLGPNSNVNSIHFQYNALSPTRMSGRIQDRRLNTTVPLETFASTRIPLAREPSTLTQRHTRVQQFRESGLDTLQAYARAQAQTDRAADNAVTVSGELDALRYEGLLKPRGLVGLRGAGDTYDGFYYVKRVSHAISEGTYKQNFTLTRDGKGTNTPVVIP